MEYELVRATKVVRVTLGDERRVIRDGMYDVMHAVYFFVRGENPKVKISKLNRR